jgi:GT2 family glycosyltransferase
MRRIAAVVVTYNRKELLRQCVDCLRRQTVHCEIWIVDNASTDGTQQMVQTWVDPELFYRNTGKNLGGAGGFACGVRAAVEAGCDSVWLMDDDTLPEPEALAELLAAETRLPHGYGWLSSRALTPDGTDQPMNRQRKTPYRDIGGYNDAEIPSVMASFVSLFLRADTVKKYGLPIAEFFIWSDDWEYTRRISRRELCYTIPASRVVHAMRSSTVVNIAQDSPERLPRYRYFYRNDVVLYRGEGIQGWAWLLLKDIWHSVQVIAGHSGDKQQRLHLIWNGLHEGMHFFPVIQYPQMLSPSLDEEKTL